MFSMLMLDVAPGPADTGSALVTGVVVILTAVLLAGFVLFIKKRKRG